MCIEGRMNVFENVLISAFLIAATLVMIAVAAFLFQIVIDEVKERKNK